MRPLWTGSVSFGLVNIPVRLFSASEERALSFHMLHKKDLEPIRFARVCKHDGQEVPWKDIVKGYEYRKGHYVVLSDEDFRHANVRRTKTIDLVSFAEEASIDSVYYEKPYYLAPDKAAEKPYALLREAMEKSGKVGIAKFVLRNREHVAVLKPESSVIVLNQLRFAEELRAPKGLKLPTGKGLSKKELEMAEQLIENLSEPFEPKKFKDSYTRELENVIAKKAKGQVIKPRGKEPKPSEVSDIMALLKKSLEKGRGRKEQEAA